MPGVSTTGSSNIAVLDSKILASLCDGKFYVDATPSIYIGSGADNVLGAKVQIINPFNVEIKPYGTDYEIAPALSGGMDAIINFNIPTQAGTYQYGKYTINVKLYDADGTSWVVTKYVTLKEADSKNKTRNYGTLSALLKASCKDGKLTVIVDNVPNYSGKVVESQTNDFTLKYPTESGLDPLETTLGGFSVKLYEGQYKLDGEICATYNIGDNVYILVKYKVKREKIVRCIIDECCVFSKLSELNLKIKSDCTTEEKNQSASITVEALRLLKTAQLAADCGEDPSEYIGELEDLLQCQCTCNCNEGTPIINTSPSKDFSITGCNVSKETVGLTDVYTIENYEYVISVVDNGGALIVSSQVLDGCTKKQSLTFSIAVVYNQIKGLSNATQNEANFWASIINKVMSLTDASCIGYNPTQWANKTFFQKVQAMLDFMCNCCGCDAAIVGDIDITHNGNDVTISWPSVSLSTYELDIYLDGVKQATVLSSITQYTFLGAADGSTHEYIITPRCSNGRPGTPVTGEFAYLACAYVAPPSLSQDEVTDAECPYDLTQDPGLASPPFGITYEWHNANNTSPLSLVGDPTNAPQGVYFVFAKNADGCYSTGVQFIVICDTGTSCSAPQNLLVSKFGSGFLVQFQSAAYPPPGNSYTVKRRLKSDPDVSGSYTVIGTPTWNASASRWEILDSSASDNTLYTYRAISNCGGSPGGTPSIDYDFANITCPSVTLTPHNDSIDYSFAPVGGQVDKYEVLLYDSTGTILIHTDTFVPAFSNPITGSFSSYLDPNTSYKVAVRVCIGTYCKTCASQSVTTTNDSFEISTRFSVLIGDVCGAENLSLFIEAQYSDVAPGVVVYDDPGLTTPHQGHNYITNSSGNIFNLDNLTGEVGADTLTAC